MEFFEANGALKGEGMNCFKAHDLASAAYNIRRIGCLLNADASCFERCNKGLKDNDKRIGTSRANDGSSMLLKRAVALDMGRQLQATEAAEADKLFGRPAQAAETDFSDERDDSDDDGEDTAS